MDWGNATNILPWGEVYDVYFWVDCGRIVVEGVHSFIFQDISWDDE